MTPNSSWCPLAFALLLSATAGCASPVEPLWPPLADQPTRAIIISVDAWHAVIALPLAPRTEAPGLTSASSPRQARGLSQPKAVESRTEAPPAEETSQSSALPSTRLGALRLSKGSPQHLYEEWGYAEQGWYLENRRGISGVFRALFWPTAGVVEVASSATVWAERTPDPPADTYRFAITEEGYQRLRHHLENTIATRAPLLTSGVSTFYPAARSYHLFHQCHQYAARALREAGLPVSPAWALTRSLFAGQLRRAEELAKAARPAGPS